MQAMILNNYCLNFRFEQQFLTLCESAEQN